MTNITIERALLEQALDALDGLVKWDSRRDFVVPYRVRDPIHDAVDSIRAHLVMLEDKASIGADRAAQPQGEPVAWMHSKTGRVSESPYDLSLADADETAIPLYESPPLSEAEIQDLRDRAVGMLETSFSAHSPQWHDAPTVPGAWICADKEHVKRTHTITPGILPVISKFGDRWYGPIPEDKP